MSNRDIKNLPGVTQTEKTKTIVLFRKSSTHPVYRVPLKYLYYNDKNDRISTEVVRYTTDHGDALPDDEEEYNMVFEELIVKSKEDAIIKTQKSIDNRGQDVPGVVLKDGRVIDGNRRFTCLRRIQREKNIEQYFETIILDFDYTNDYKGIKSLELELQMGVDEKVKYDPIDRLFGVYNSIRVQKAFTVEEYAKLFDDYTVKSVEADLELADLMCEYLEFLGTPGKYYIAKDMDLEGTLHEIPSILNKVRSKNPELVDDVKLRIFSSISVGVSSRLNLFMREIKQVVADGDLERYLSETEEAVNETIQKIEENPINSYTDLSDGIRSCDELKEKLVEPVSSQTKVIESKNLKKAPLKYSKDAATSLSAIRMDLLQAMSDEDKADLRLNLEKIEHIIEDIRRKM